jgi:hypothetical protein
MRINAAVGSINTHAHLHTAGTAGRPAPGRPPPTHLHIDACDAEWPPLTRRDQDAPGQAGCAPIGSAGVKSRLGAAAKRLT